MQSFDIQPDKELKREALKYIRGNKEHACFKSLTLFGGDLIDAMTDELPTMASMISVSEMSFASRKETDKKNRIKIGGGYIRTFHHMAMTMLSLMFQLF